MLQEIKDRWLAALRSGTYQQAKGSLRNNGKFCCLGVLCDLHDPSQWEERSTSDWRYLGETATLPIEIVHWADLPDGNPDIGPWTLASLNDAGKSFTELADIIEEKL